MTNPTADPAARTVFDQRIFSAVRGDTVGNIRRGTSVSAFVSGMRVEDAVEDEGGGELMVNVPMKEWMSLLGASAGEKKTKFRYPGRASKHPRTITENECQILIHTINLGI